MLVAVNPCRLTENSLTKASGQRAIASSTAILTSAEIPSTLGIDGLDELKDALVANLEDSETVIPLRLAAQKTGANSDGTT